MSMRDASDSSYSPVPLAQHQRSQPKLRIDTATLLPPPFTSSRRSANSAAPLSLSDSPVELPQLDLPYPPTFSFADGQESSPSRPRSGLPSRQRRPSLSGVPLPRLQNSYVDFAGASHNLAAGLSLPPPVVADAMAPLQLDFERARELESEEPLSLPRPWLFSGRDTSSTSRGSAAAAADLASEELARTRSRSPDRVYNRLSVSHASSRKHAEHLEQKLAQIAASKLSTSPPSAQEMPNTRFVEGLVGAACIAVDVVWKSGEEQQTGYVMINGLPTPRASPTSGVSPHDSLSTSSSSSDRSVLPLRHFIKEVLRRSRSTCSTLQTALYYIHKSRDAIRHRVKDADEARAELLRLRSSSGEISWHAHSSSSSSGIPGAEHIQLAPRTAAALLAKTRDPVLCGRRMFLAALICASKFLQDRTYSNRAWSKISSLPVKEINANEKAFLELMDYNLYVDADLFKNWTRRLQDLAEKHDRKAAAPAPALLVSDFTLPKPSLNAVLRDSLGRSQSDYPPAPELTDTARAGSQHSGNSSRYGVPHAPLTPAASPRHYLSKSPVNSRPGISPPSWRSLGGTGGAADSMQRSHSEGLLEHVAAGRLPSLGAIDLSSRSDGRIRLPLPALSTKGVQYGSASPSPLSGGASAGAAKRYALPASLDEEEEASPIAAAGGLPRPSLSRRYGTSAPNLPEELHRPMLGKTRYDSASGALEGSTAHARRAQLARGGHCSSSLSRLLNATSAAEAGDWRDGSNMVI